MYAGRQKFTSCKCEENAAMLFNKSSTVLHAHIRYSGVYERRSVLQYCDRKENLWHLSMQKIWWQERKKDQC